MEKFTFVTDCVHSTADKINAMIESSTQITWETFIKHVDIEEIRSLFGFYAWHGESVPDGWNGRRKLLHIKDDYTVTFNKGTYEDKPCYYIVHSAIEYIFQDRS